MTSDVHIQRAIPREKLNGGGGKISRGHNKVMEFSGVLAFALAVEFPRGLTQFCRISRVEAFLFCLEFPGT